ncbi:MAG TPA: PPOX class F420-dependent oxidoreductase [Candidatus Binatia bacterium]|jgi:PPOX class probable F420-dependent enzyme
MAEKIPEAFKDVLNKRGFAHLATPMKDGSPHVTPVWYDFDGTHIRINSAKGRLKDKNMRRDKRVALSIQDPDNPYRYIAISGDVDEITENGADAHIDALAKKYLDKDRYPFRAPGEVRVIYKIRPDKISTVD